MAAKDTHRRRALEADIRELLDSDRLRSRFEAEVIADTPDVIEAEVSALIDWISDREHASWQFVRDRLAERTASKALLVEASTGPAGFASRRRALLETTGRESDAVAASFDPAAESSRRSSPTRGSGSWPRHGRTPVDRKSHGLTCKATRRAIGLTAGTVVSSWRSPLRRRGRPPTPDPSVPGTAEIFLFARVGEGQ